MDEIKLNAFLENFKIGLKGEESLRDHVKKHGHRFFQADCISYDPKGEKYYLWEAKCKERFKAPPFDGHGLPLIQIQARLQFYKDTGIRPILYIKDATTGEIFVQAMDILANCDSKMKFVTKKRIIIFHLECFTKLK